MLASFVALAGAIVAVPFPWPFRWGRTPPLWAVLFVGAMVLGLYEGILEWSGLLALVLLAGLLRQAGSQTRAFSVYHALAAVLIIALGAHWMPGFYNSVLFNAIKTSADAAPYSFHLNFDKAGAGLLIYALLARRVKSASDVHAVAYALMTALPMAWLVLAIVGTAIGWFRFEPKLPAFTGEWMLGNLLFVAVAEDGFIRAFVQEPLHQAMANRSGAFWLPMVTAALVFGGIHFAGGSPYVALASLAGLANAWAYARTRCLEAGVLVHFLTNTGHFVLFTYPYLQH